MNNTRALLASIHAVSPVLDAQGTTAGAATASPPEADIEPGCGDSDVDASWAVNPVHNIANKKNE